MRPSKQAQELCWRRWQGRQPRDVVRVGNLGVPRAFEIVEQPTVVRSLAPGILRQEMLRTAPEEDADAVDLSLVKKSSGDPRSGVPIRGVHGIGRRSRVGDVGGRDDADVEAAAPRAGEKLTDVLHAGIVERVGGIVGKHTRLVVAVFLPGRIRGHPRR